MTKTIKLNAALTTNSRNNLVLNFDYVVSKDFETITRVNSTTVRISNIKKLTWYQTPLTYADGRTEIEDEFVLTDLYDREYKIDKTIYDLAVKGISQIKELNYVK